MLQANRSVSSFILVSNNPIFTYILDLCYTGPVTAPPPSLFNIPTPCRPPNCVILTILLLFLLFYLYL
jgi:hypothetical protein